MKQHHFKEVVRWVIIFVVFVAFLSWAIYLYGTCIPFFTRPIAEMPGVCIMLRK